MTAARENILAKLHSALVSRGVSRNVSGPDGRMQAHAANLIPARGKVAGAEALTDFVQRMTNNFATAAIVATDRDVPRAAGDYLLARNLSGPIRLSAEPGLGRMPWEELRGVEILQGGLSETDAVGVSSALCGIAETGTLLLHSGPHAPSGLSFLPETHIVVLYAADIVGALEDAWARLRQATNGMMPRTVNLISGPSRTADIGMTMIMGAHGPKRLHVIVIANDA